MDVSNAIIAVNTVLHTYRGKCLTDLEKAVFLGAWEGLTYEEMEQDTRFCYAEKTLKDAGSLLWKDISQAIGVTVKKTDFKTAIEYHQVIQRFQGSRSILTSV
jgi:hypothetical protein